MLTVKVDSVRRNHMSGVDFNHLSTEQRLDLIDELWGSIDIDRLPLTPAQAAEIDRRYVCRPSPTATAADGSRVVAARRPG